MTERDHDHDADPAVARAKGKDVDGLTTLPGVHSSSGAEKAGTGEEESDETAHGPAATSYPRHPPVGGPPSRHG